MTTLVWFRQDLRLADNPALTSACEIGPVLPIYILDETHSRPIGGASRWWLHHSLAALDRAIGGLAFLRGDPLSCLRAVIEATGATSVVWNRCYEPEAIQRDKEIKAALTAEGIGVKSFNGSLLYEPWEVETNSGGPFKVYSPFWRNIQQRSVSAPLRPPQIVRAERDGLGDKLEDWALLPVRPNWAGGWGSLWSPGEAGASEQLAGFLASGIEGYSRLRDRPDLENVSRLSPHLHFGEISPRQVWAKARFAADKNPKLEKDIGKFLSEVAWREFSYHLLFHFPELPSQNWRSSFDAYPWRENERDLEAWQKGQTGYPIVDAGMRELWHTGYMHNRVRMVVASFLVKHLRLHWKHGEEWFWDTLVDANLANNSASWQWVTGSGADAAPYFRIFNPIVQGRKFDPDGAYIRKWCPELEELDTSVIFAPWEATLDQLEAAGIKLGETYPQPMVDHPQARAAALAGYEAVKAANI